MTHLPFRIAATFCLLFAEAGVGESVSVVSLPQPGRVPDAEVDEAGVIHVAYLADDNIYYVKSVDRGETLSDPIRVNSEAGYASGGAHRGPDLAIGKDGQVHIIWFNAAYQQGRAKDQWGVMYARLGPAGKAFEVSRNLNRRPSDNFSLAADQHGKVAVIWMAGGVFATLSEDGGESFLPSVDLKTDPCECCASRAIYTDDGSLVVLYRDKADNDRDTFLAVLPDGQREFRHEKISATPWEISACPMTGGDLNLAQEGLVAGWETQGRIYFRRLNSPRKPNAGREVLVAERGRYPIALCSERGESLVAWKDDGKLHWQRFDPQGKPVGPPGSQKCPTDDRPTGVVTAKGYFVLFP